MKPEAHILCQAWSGAAGARVGRDIHKSRHRRAGGDTAEILQVAGAKMQLRDTNTVSTGRVEPACYVGFGPARTGCVPDEISAEMASGVCESIDATEIPQVGEPKTRLGGVGTVSTERSGLSYHARLCPAWIGCVLVEISARIASGAREYQHGRDSAGRQRQGAGEWR
jgi:hypothetical protein